MYKRIDDLKARLPKEHQDMAFLTQHIFESLDNLVDEHQRFVGVNATAGVPPIGEAERAFHETIQDVEHIIISQLEKTTQDIEHEGDKNWEKNYKEGID